MANRLINMVFAVFLGIIFLSLISIHDNRNLISTSLPVSHDTGSQGLSRLHEWLKKSEIRTTQLQSSYEKLIGQDGTLLTMLPFTIAASRSETDALKTWVRNGNHLIMMLAMNDVPHWRNKKNMGTVAKLLSEFDLALASIGDAQTQDAPHSNGNYLASRIAYPLTSNIKRIKIPSQSMPISLQLSGIASPTSSIILLRDNASSTPVAWHTVYGKGRITLFSYATLFSNNNLTEDDNLQLASNLILHGGNKSKTVIFDDIHHYRLKKSTAPPLTISHPLVLLLLGSISYVLIRIFMFYISRSNRNMSLQNFPVLLDVITTEQRKNLAKLTNNDLAKSICISWFNNIRYNCNLPRNGQPVWDILETSSADRNLVHKARKSWERLSSGRNINLKKFTNRLEKIRKSHL